MCCGVEGFNLDLGAMRHTFISDYAITPPALYVEENIFLFHDLPYVEIAGNAPVLPVFSGTLLLS
jgi:hypothetical protein